jgi:hypothetical protein
MVAKSISVVRLLIKEPTAIGNIMVSTSLKIVFHSPLARDTLHALGGLKNIKVTKPTPVDRLIPSTAPADAKAYISTLGKYALKLS